MTNEEKIEIRSTFKKGLWGLFVTVVITAFYLGVTLEAIQGSIKKNTSAQTEYQLRQREFQRKIEGRLGRIENDLYFKASK